VNAEEGLGSFFRDHASSCMHSKGQKMSDPEEGPIGPKGQLATPAFLAAIICCGSLLLSVVPIWHLPTPKQRNGGAHTPSLMLPAHCTRCIVFLVLVAALRYSILAYLESLATLFCCFIELKCGDLQCIAFISFLKAMQVLCASGKCTFTHRCANHMTDQ